jgi:hypothetical protein
MGTQALRMLRGLGLWGVKICYSASADLNQQIRGCKLADCEDFVDQTTTQPLVQMKNLFRQKDNQGPCLEDANDLQHLPLNGKQWHQICIVYSELGPIKEAKGKGACLNPQPDIVEATSPVKNKKGEQRSRSNISSEEQERRTESRSLLSIVNCKEILIFPLKDLLLFLIFPPKTYCCSLFSHQRPVVHYLYN